MNLKIGDRVRFLNETGGGIIKKFIGNNLVEVETADGWAIPYVTSDLVVIPADPNVAPYRGTQIDDSSVKNITGKKFDAEIDEIFLLVSQMKSDNDGYNGIQLVLVNDSNFSFTFSFYVERENAVSLEMKDELEPGIKISLQEFSLPHLSDIKSFIVQGIVIKDEGKTLPPVVNRTIPYNNKKYSAAGAYTENDYLHENAILFPLLSYEDPVIQTVIKEDDLGTPLAATGSNGKKRDKAEITREVDLHINQLVNSVVGMSNREILTVQMNTFEKELSSAIENREKSIVFIHGIGNGTLKETLRKTIDKDYPICSHEDGSFKDYGFGATMVRIRQNR